MKNGLLITLLLVFSVMILSESVQAATVHGKIYGPGLDIVKNAMVYVNSTPRQNMVSPDGTYSFTLPQGDYTIEAIYASKGILLYDRETINLPSEGDFTSDLILFESPDIENISFDEQELRMIEELLKEKPKTNWLLIAGIAAGAIIIAAVIFFVYKRRKKPKVRKAKRRFRAKALKQTEEKPVGDEVMAKAMEILKRERRVNQKDLRKEIGVSEAKLSLVIADLEAQGKVQKIKRGRGNIILYKE